jgi:hypothetical protein
MSLLADKPVSLSVFETLFYWAPNVEKAVRKRLLACCFNFIREEPAAAPAAGAGVLWVFLARGRGRVGRGGGAAAARPLPRRAGRCPGTARAGPTASCPPAPPPRAVPAATTLTGQFLDSHDSPEGLMNVRHTFRYAGARPRRAPMQPGPPRAAPRRAAPPRAASSRALPSHQRPPPPAGPGRALPIRPPQPRRPRGAGRHDGARPGHQRGLGPLLPRGRCAPPPAAAAAPGAVAAARPDPPATGRRAPRHFLGPLEPRAAPRLHPCRAAPPPVRPPGGKKTADLFGGPKRSVCIGTKTGYSSHYGCGGGFQRVSRGSPGTAPPSGRPVVPPIARPPRPPRMQAHPLPPLAAASPLPPQQPL